MEDDVLICPLCGSEHIISISPEHNDYWECDICKETFGTPDTQNNSF